MSGEMKDIDVIKMIVEKTTKATEESISALEARLVEQMIGLEKRLSEQIAAFKERLLVEIAASRC